MNKKQRILEKYSGKCCFCGRELHLDMSRIKDGGYLQLDHILPKSNGGNRREDNLRAICRSCNSSRQNITGEKMVRVILDKFNNANMKTREMFIIDDANNGFMNEADIDIIREALDAMYKENQRIINKMYRAAYPQEKNISANIS